MLWESTSPSAQDHETAHAVLPHLDSATVEARVDMGEKVINISTWMDGHRPPDRAPPRML